jgi:anti-anti-sigma factor
VAHCGFRTFADGPVIRVALSGELCLGTAEDAEDELRRTEWESYEQIVLDLRRISFIDARGLLVIFELHERCRETGTCLGILPGTHHVQRVFVLTGLIERLPFIGTSDGRRATY